MLEIAWTNRHLLKRIFAIKPKRQLRELYVFLLFFSFASALVTVFEPIFFFTQGFSLEKISLFYATHYTLYVLLLPLGGKFALRFGYERSLAISTPIIIFYLFTLARLPQQPNLFWVAIMILTLHKIFFWPALHATMSKFSTSNNRGTEISWAHFIIKGSGIIGPLLGGFIAAIYGFPTLFLLASGFFTISSLALLRTPENYQSKHLPYTEVWRVITRRRHKRMVVGMIAWGEDLIYLVFWPIFMITVLQSTERIGLIVGLSTAVMTVWGFFVGELSDRYSPRRVLRIAAPLVSIGYLIRLFTTTPLFVLLGDVYMRTANVSIGIPFVARLYKNSKAVGPVLYAISFELVLAITKAAAAWIMAAIFLFMPAALGIKIAFIAAAIFALFYAAI